MKDEIYSTAANTLTGKIGVALLCSIVNSTKIALKIIQEFVFEMLITDLNEGKFDVNKVPSMLEALTEVF